MSGLDELKAAYTNTPIPSELNAVVNNAIGRGTIHMRNRKRKSNYLKLLGAAAAGFLVFAIALNTSSAFADNVSRLPGGETVVRLLTFVGELAMGGAITDGQDIRYIRAERRRRAECESIVVGFTAGFDFTQVTPGGEPAGTAGHFTVTRNTHPNSIVVHVAGVRGFTAAQNLPDLSRMQLLGSIYRIVTLDDSAHRFVVTFNRPVTVEVSEQRNPARIIIRVREDQQAAELPVMYSLRTASMPWGEGVGSAEELLKFTHGSSEARILRDATGLYFAEEGLYATRAEAEARLSELKNSFTWLALHIEQRDAAETPKSMKQ